MKKFLALALLIAVLSMGGCSSSDSTSSESGSSAVSDNAQESAQSGSSAGTASESDSSPDDTASGTNEAYDSSEDQNGKNPGLDVHTTEYNSADYMLDINTVRFIVDDDGNVIEPENNNESPLKYVYNMSEYEYIGTGDLLGTRSDAKLYLTDDGNILSVYPCEIEPYADAEEILSKYSKDKIFEANCFIKINSSEN